MQTRTTIIDFFKSKGLDLCRNLSQYKSEAIEHQDILPGCTSKMEISLDGEKDLPPRSFSLSYQASDNIYDGHKTIASFFTDLFGEAQDHSASNTISNVWIEEDLRLSITSFPHDMQPSYLAGQTANLNTTIRINNYSLKQFSLNDFLKSADKHEIISLSDDSEFSLVSRCERRTLKKEDYRYTYKNTDSNTDIKNNKVIIAKNSESLLFSNGLYAIILPTNKYHFLLSQALAAKGGGYSSISFKSDNLYFEIFVGNEKGPLTITANTIESFFGVQVETVTFHNT